MKSFNMNEYVGVKLTPVGIEALREKHERLLKSVSDNPIVSKTIGEFTPPETDEKGYTFMQMYKMMNAFGSFMKEGTIHFPLDMDILILEKDINEPTRESRKHSSNKGSVFALNLNSPVKVKLSLEGKEMLEEDLRTDQALLGNQRELKYPDTDAEGYTEIQITDMMRIFGKSMYHGNPKQPIDCDILISEEYLKEVVKSNQDDSTSANTLEGIVDQMIEEAANESPVTERPKAR